MTISSNDQAEQQRRKLLLQLKKQYNTPYLPHTLLYEMTHTDSKKLEEPRLVWFASGGGLGDPITIPAQENEAAAAHELLERGSLVRAFNEYDYFLNARITPLQLAEDANWGVDEKGFFRMFQLDEQGREDKISPLEEGQNDAAILEVQRQLESGYAYIDENKVRLTSGIVLSPIVFGRKQASLHKRQMQAIEP